MSRSNESFAGHLRSCVLFHETEPLGASTAVLRLVPLMEEFGWTTSGWFPGHGSLAEATSPSLLEAPIRAPPGCL